MSEENQSNGIKRMSLKKSTSSSTAVQGNKKVQVEVRKKKILVDPKVRKAQLEAEEKAREEARKAEALRLEQEKAQKEADVRTIEHIWARFGQALYNVGKTDKELRDELNKSARNNREFEIFMGEDRVAALEDFSCTDVKQNDPLPFHYGFRIEDAIRLCKDYVNAKAIEEISASL